MAPGRDLRRCSTSVRRPWPGTARSRPEQASHPSGPQRGRAAV